MQGSNEGTGVLEQIFGSNVYWIGVGVILLAGAIYAIAQILSTQSGRKKNKAQYYLLCGIALIIGAILLKIFGPALLDRLINSSPT